MSENASAKIDLNKIHSYDYIFHQIVLPLAQEMAEEVDPKFKSECDFEILETEAIYLKSHALYKQKREMIKSFFYGDVFFEKDKYLDDDSYRLDLHKIASIICSTLIRNKIFWYDEKKAKKYLNDNKKLSTDWKIKNILINYRLAVHTSFSLIYYKMLFDLNQKDEQQKKLYEKIENQEGLYLYPTNDSHESFENSIILDFAKRDIDNRSFDYLLYSTLLYQLEEYNREKFNKI